MPSRPRGLTANREQAGLVNQVLATCWHTTAEAIGKLRDWRDQGHAAD